MILSNSLGSKLQFHPSRSIMETFKKKIILTSCPSKRPLARLLRSPASTVPPSAGTFPRKLLTAEEIHVLVRSREAAPLFKRTCSGRCRRRWGRMWRVGGGVVGEGGGEWGVCDGGFGGGREGEGRREGRGEGTEAGSTRVTKHCQDSRHASTKEKPTRPPPSPPPLPAPLPLRPSPPFPSPLSRALLTTNHSRDTYTHFL